MDRESKLNALLDKMKRVMSMFGEQIVERYGASLNVDYLEQRMIFPEQEQT